MNLSTLFQMQKELDDYIIEKKCLQGVDLLPQKILALQVELGECAQEWRGFKFWSERQTSNTSDPKQCPKCRGFGIVSKYVDDNGIATMKCDECNGVGEIPNNPLLEEYVDCLHFILSIGIEVEFLEIDWSVYQWKAEKLYTITNQFTEIIKLAPTSYIRMVNLFLGLGEMLGFTWNQIESAYTEKWNINKKRQESGY